MSPCRETCFEARAGFYIYVRYICILFVYSSRLAYTIDGWIDKDERKGDLMLKRFVAEMVNEQIFFEYIYEKGFFLDDAEQGDWNELSYFFFLME